MGRTRARQAGLTLLEVMVASAILAFLALVLLSATIPLQHAAHDAGVGVSMDAEGGRVLAALRRELRQSGFDSTGVLKLTAPAEGAAGSTLSFCVREGMTDADWSPLITYEILPASSQSGGPTFQGVAGNPPRYTLWRTQAGLAVAVAEDVSLFDVNFPLNGSTLRVTLQIMHPDPRWVDAAPPPAFVRTYSDEVEMLNPRP